MPFIYGSLPTTFSGLMTLTLTHPDFNSGAAGTVTLSDSGNDWLSFENAVAALNVALRAATGNDLNVSWNYENSRVVYLYSEAEKTWSIASWKARGFFGYEYPISNYYPSGSEPSGALWCDGLTVDSVEMATTSEKRSDPGDGYSLIKGKILNITAYILASSVRHSKNITKGAGSSIDWSAYKGVITCQPGSDSAAYSLTNLDGKLTDAELIEIKLRGRETLMAAEVWRVDMKVQIE